MFPKSYLRIIECVPLYLRDKAAFIDKYSKGEVGFEAESHRIMAALVQCYAKAYEDMGEQLSKIIEQYQQSLAHVYQCEDVDFFTPVSSFTWFTQGSSENLLALQSDGLKKFPLSRDLVAQHAVCLYEMKGEDTALGFLESRDEYMNMDFGQYLPLAYLLNKRGPRLHRYANSAFVFSRLEESRQNSAFEKLIENRSVCLVGNSPIEIGKGRGAEIDAHEIVIRFNNYSTDAPYSIDYGTKTDIWVRSGANDVVDRKDAESYKMVVWEEDYWHRQCQWNFPKLLYRDVRKSVLTVYADFALHNALRKITDLYVPSTGLVMCYWVYRIKGSLPLNSLFGFSMVDQLNNPGNKHYFTIHPNGVGGHHNWIVEKEALTKMIEGSF